LTDELQPLLPRPPNDGCGKYDRFHLRHGDAVTGDVLHPVEFDNKFVDPHGAQLSDAVVVQTPDFG
jgi:hypothetical protein